MRSTRMATHSVSSFNEAEAIRILSDFLESKRKIKTFFKENDRTPNYDGTFEIINGDKTPKKQFIVQIKKVEGLEKNIKGENKGKYVYSLDTAFLYYVKEKVAESPAIFFVVDVITKNIFWIYLSDEKLMSMDFENANGNVSYAFSEEDILSDIDDFTNILDKIANERNSLFVYKTPEEISKMQDAVDYINNYMNNDFATIKEKMFPNLWRFGLRHSHTSSLTITIRDKTINPQNTAMYALYPQIKGKVDTGIQEYSGGKIDNLFNNYDLSGAKTPIEYSRETLEKIIKTFFDKQLAFEFFPDIALSEKLYFFANQVSKVFVITDDTGDIVVKKIYNGFFWLLKYVDSVILKSPKHENEKAFNKAIISILHREGTHSCDFISLCIQYKCELLFEDFCKLNNTNETPRFNMGMLGLLKEDHIRYYMIALEMDKRNILKLDNIWDYDYYELSQLPEKQFMDEVNKICEKWFSCLPALYNETFDKLFDKNKYRFVLGIEYKNEEFHDDWLGPRFSSIVRKYERPTFYIIYNPDISIDYTDKDKEEGLKYIENGFIFDRFLQRKTLIYDSLNCLLYNGICKGLGIKAKSLSVGYDSMKLF